MSENPDGTITVAKCYEGSFAPTENKKDEEQIYCNSDFRQYMYDNRSMYLTVTPTYSDVLFGSGNSTMNLEVQLTGEITP